jgi:hypothetical protein
MCTKI